MSDLRTRAPQETGRIAVMLPRFSRYGGVEQFAWRLAEGLAKRGHHVDFICSRQEVEAPPGVTVLPQGRLGLFPSLKMLWFAWRAEHVRRRGGYDLSVSLGKTWNQDILRVGGGPLPVYQRLSLMAWPPGPSRFLKRAQRFCSLSTQLILGIEKRQYGCPCRLVAVSHLVRDWIVETHPERSRSAIDIIYNRPDLSRFYPPSPEERRRAREQLGIGPDDRAVGVATTNFRLKGVGPLIESMAQLPEHVKLFVAGGRDARFYRKLAGRLGVAGRVHFLGKVTEMPAFYQALDLFSLPTYYDACANATLEALASGLRVITSAVNGAAYFLPPENVTTQPADPGELARMIAGLLERPSPAPFSWPAAVPSGLEAFMDLVEEELEHKRAGK